MTPLAWRDAITTDRSALPSFRCTADAKRLAGTFKKHHDRQWELDVQAVIRSRRPPFQPPLFMLVGLDDLGIAAAAIYEELDGPGLVELQFMAVAERCRRSGGVVADELFAEVLRRLEERAILRRERSVQVTAKIHGSNVPSQNMAIRARLRHVHTYDNGVQAWATGFETAVVGDERSDDYEAPDTLF